MQCVLLCARCYTSTLISFKYASMPPAQWGLCGPHYLFLLLSPSHSQHSQPPAPQFCPTFLFLKKGSFNREITLYFLKRFYLFIFREGERKGEREGEKHWHVRDTSVDCLSHTHNQGPGLQPRHVPWLGIEPVTFQFTGWHSIHWATLARATLSYFYFLRSWHFLIYTLLFYWLSLSSSPTRI